MSMVPDEGFSIKFQSTRLREARRLSGLGGVYGGMVSIHAPA